MTIESQSYDSLHIPFVIGFLEKKTSGKFSDTLLKTTQELIVARWDFVEEKAHIYNSDSEERNGSSLRSGNPGYDTLIPFKYSEKEAEDFLVSFGDNMRDFVKESLDIVIIIGSEGRADSLFDDIIVVLEELT